MQNKRHKILDDAWDMDSDLMGGAAHTMRVGLVTNTVMNATPVVIKSLDDFVVDPTIDISNVPMDTLPVLLNFSYNDIQVAMLMVHDKDSGHVQCYPFSDAVDGKWWIYEIAFDIVPGGQLEIRPINPLAEHMDPTKEMMNHLEAIAMVAHMYLRHLQDGTMYLEEETTDFTKINAKRVKNGKSPIVNNWIVKYVEGDKTAS